MMQLGAACVLCCLGVCPLWTDTSCNKVREPFKFSNVQAAALPKSQDLTASRRLIGAQQTPDGDPWAMWPQANSATNHPPSVATRQRLIKR